MIEVNIETVVNDTSYFFLKEENLLLKNLSSVKLPLKQCCEKIYSEISADVEYIRKTSLTNQLYWSTIRQFKITGSRCYSIFTYSQKLKSDDQWESKASK